MARRRSPGLRLCGASWCSDRAPLLSFKPSRSIGAPLVQRRRVSVALTPPNPKPLSMACVTFMGRGLRHPVQPVGQRIGRVQIFSAPGTTWSTPWWATASGATSRPNTATRLAGGAPWPRYAAMDAARAGGGVSEVFAQSIGRNIQRTGWKTTPPALRTDKKRAASACSASTGSPSRVTSPGARRPSDQIRRSRRRPRQAHHCPPTRGATRRQGGHRRHRHAQRYCRRWPFRGSTTTAWPKPPRAATDRRTGTCRCRRRDPGPA